MKDSQNSIKFDPHGNAQEGKQDNFEQFFLRKSNYWKKPISVPFWKPSKLLIPISERGELSILIDHSV